MPCDWKREDFIDLSAGIDFVYWPYFAQIPPDELWVKSGLFPGPVLLTQTLLGASDRGRSYDQPLNRCKRMQIAPICIKLKHCVLNVDETRHTSVVTPPPKKNSLCLRFWIFLPEAWQRSWFVSVPPTDPAVISLSALLQKLLSPIKHFCLPLPLPLPHPTIILSIIFATGILSCFCGSWSSTTRSSAKH